MSPLQAAHSVGKLSADIAAINPKPTHASNAGAITVQQRVTRAFAVADGGSGHHDCHDQAEGIDRQRPLAFLDVLAFVITL